MKTVGVHQAKTNLSRILAEVENGQTYVIARGGKPVARLVPAAPVKKTEVELGLLRGQYQVPDDFDSWYSKEILEMFEGSA